MAARTIIGSLLTLAGFLLGYHAFRTIGGWQYRNQEALGVAGMTPVIELVLGFVAVVFGFWFLFTKPKS